MLNFNFEENYFFTNAAEDEDIDPTAGYYGKLLSVTITADGITYNADNNKSYVAIAEVSVERVDPDSILDSVLSSVKSLF